MKKTAALVLALLLILVLVPAWAEGVTGKVVEIEKYGHAVLDITIEDFAKAGFDLGDVVTVTAGTFTGDMPYLNGYYVDKDEYMLRAFPGHTRIALCVNYGKFAEAAGVGVGDTVTLTMKEKAGALALQEISNLVFSDDRANYPSNEAYANFRALAEGRLYRSVSPVDTNTSRAACADQFSRAVGIQAVMNVAFTEAEVAAFFEAEDFASPYYRELFEAGRVIVLGMPVSFSSDEFAEGLVKGFTFLAEHEGPYLVHCVDGKDRTGFAALVLEALMGWNEEAIIADYMRSYVNLYGVQPGTEKYQMIAEKNAVEMLRGLAREGMSLQAAAEAYLTDHGMAEEALKALEEKLK